MLYGDCGRSSTRICKTEARPGKPVVYKVNTKQMQADGYVFYQSVNGVWLTKHVPVKYLEKVMHED